VRTNVRNWNFRLLKRLSDSRKPHCFHQLLLRQLFLLGTKGRVEVLESTPFKQSWIDHVKKPIGAKRFTIALGTSQ
jgi:hypothetical protein